MAAPLKAVEKKAFFEIVQPCEKVTFHSNDINIDGKMSDTFYMAIDGRPAKVSTITAMGWTQTGHFMIKARKVRVFGSAAIKDSVLE